MSLTSGVIQSQDIKPASEISKDSLTAEDKNLNHSLYAIMGYGNNMLYMGSTISQDHAYESLSLIYGFRDELYVSFSGFHLHDMNPFAAFFNTSVNYNHTVNSWFDYALTFSYFGVQKSLADSLFAGFTYGSATAGFDWKIMYTKVSVSGVFSKENRFYYQIRNSRYFETGAFLNGKAVVSFDPYVNLLLGTMLKYETVEGTKTTSSPPFRPWKNRTPNPTLKPAEFFGPMEVDFGLPVTLSYDYFSLEAEPGYILPLYKLNSGQKGFIFLLNAYIRIFQF